MDVILQLLRRYGVRPRAGALQELLARGGYSAGGGPSATQGAQQALTQPSPDAPFFPPVFHVPFAWRLYKAQPELGPGASWAAGNAGRTSKMKDAY